MKQEVSTASWLRLRISYGVADTTYVPTRQGLLYLTIVLDVFSRRTMGLVDGLSLRTELVLDTLDMAVSEPRPSGGTPPANGL